jgi:hypothetical protein
LTPTGNTSFQLNDHELSSTSQQILLFDSVSHPMSQNSLTTFNTIKALATSELQPACAPGVDAMFEGDAEIFEPIGNISEAPDHSKRPESAASEASSQGSIKKMKAASKFLQFFTTIVVKVCLYVKEMHGFISSHRRACLIFKKVEHALRDRTLYPLPADVSLKDLMSCSFFKGPDAESNFKKYCESDSMPLQESMVQHADRLFHNKFTDVKKVISNHIIWKFQGILNKLTGNGKKSGQASLCCFYMFMSSQNF